MIGRGPPLPSARHLITRGATRLPPTPNIMTLRERADGARAGRLLTVAAGEPAAGSGACGLRPTSGVRTALRSARRTTLSCCASVPACSWSPAPAAPVSLRRSLKVVEGGRRSGRLETQACITPAERLPDRQRGGLVHVRRGGAAWLDGRSRRRGRNRPESCRMRTCYPVQPASDPAAGSARTEEGVDGNPESLRRASPLRRRGRPAARHPRHSVLCLPPRSRVRSPADARGRGPREAACAAPQVSAPVFARVILGQVTRVTLRQPGQSEPEDA